MTAFGQGMLGRIATGYQSDAGYGWFALFVGLCAVAAYVLLGASWLVMRVDGDLQRRAANWPATPSAGRPWAWWRSR